jgi:hypothetical protein
MRARAPKARRQQAVQAVRVAHAAAQRGAAAVARIVDAGQHRAPGALARLSTGRRRPPRSGARPGPHIYTHRPQHQVRATATLGRAPRGTHTYKKHGSCGEAR